MLSGITLPGCSCARREQEERAGEETADVHRGVNLRDVSGVRKDFSPDSGLQVANEIERDSRLSEFLFGFVVGADIRNKES